MSAGRVLSTEEVRKLIATEPEVIAARPYLSEGDETYPCTYCGCCTTPEKCVWSIECPECQAAPSEQCIQTGNRLVPLHEKRWLKVYILYGTYYK